MVARLFEMAIAGNINAAKLILSYAIGQPVPATDPDRLDLDEWKLLDQSPTRTEAMRALMDSIPTTSAVRITLDATNKAAAKDDEELITTIVGGVNGLEEFGNRLDQERSRRVEKK